MPPGGKRGTDGRVGDADPVSRAREGQDVEVARPLLPERGTPRDDTHRGVWAVVQCQQVMDLLDHVSRLLQPDVERALVNDHVQQPGHPSGLVGLAVR